MFGTGKNTKADSVVIIWSNNQKQVLQTLAADTVYTLNQKNATEIWQSLPNINQTIFNDVTASVNTMYKHTDVIYNDYADQGLLPQKYSQLGPFISTGDINKDGKVDFYIGGGFNSHGEVFMQQTSGSFAGTRFYSNIKIYRR